MSQISVDQPAVALSTTRVAMSPRVVRTPADPAIGHVDAGDLGVLMDVHTEGIRAAGVPPDDGVVPDDASRRMPQRAEYRVPRALADVNERGQPLDLSWIDHLGIDALDLVHLRAPAHRPQRGVAVRQGEMAALREHHVEVEVGSEPAVELDRAVVEPDPLWRQVVRAENRRVAARAARSQVALVQHGDVGYPVIGGQVIGGSQPVHAAADDDHVVGALQVTRAPGRRPFGVCQAVAEQAKCGVPGGIRDVTPALPVSVRDRLHGSSPPRGPRWVTGISPPHRLRQQ